MSPVSAAANSQLYFIEISAACAGYGKNIANTSRGTRAATCRRSFCAITQGISTTSSRSTKFRRASGFRDDAKIHFYNHHEAHALAPLFYSDWDDALLVTADAGSDTVNYSHRHFANGALKTIYGREECLLTPLPIDSIAYAYMIMTEALGFTPLRHEGKLTGLAAYGEPVLADKIAAHFSVDDSGRVSSNFCDYPEMEKFIHAIVKGVSREDASASIQEALERTMLRSITRLLKRTKARHLGLAGGIFAM
jgi:carbamoyltransferase